MPPTSTPHPAPPEFKPAPGDPSLQHPHPALQLPEPSLLQPAAPPPMPAAKPLPPPPPVPPARSPNAPDIALVLPLDRPAYARAAEAVQAGFLAAAEAAGANERCIVVRHGIGGVTTAFDTAKARGARVIVGPLVRDDLRALVNARGDWPVTLALNQLDDGTPLPANVYALALNVESDARVLARRALADGARDVAVVEGDAPLMHRFATAFTGDWVSGGGAAPAGYRLDPSPESLADLRRALERSGSDSVLLALDSERAALAKPYLGTAIAYASGLLFERPPPAAARDLEGLREAEIPWLLTPEAPQFATLPRRDLGSDAQNRLYALGLDAFRVAQALVGGAPARLEFDGAIGHLTLGPDRQFERTPRLGVWHDGELTLLDAPR